MSVFGSSFSYSLLCCVYTGAPSTLSPTDPTPVTGSQFPLPGVIAGKANSIKCVAKIHLYNYNRDNCGGDSAIACSHCCWSRHCNLYYKKKKKYAE